MSDGRTELGIDRNIPYGYCQCGCGEKTSIAPWDDPRVGHIKGQPVRFRVGHNGRGRSRSPNGQDYLVDEETQCWVWQRSRHPMGYGNCDRDGEQRAHRWYYLQHKGPIPEGLVLDHLCRNRACVNPDHLEPVTAGENCRRGANAKLTHDDAYAIRVLAGEGWTGPAIAEQFGISVAHARAVGHGKHWAT